MSVIIGHTYTDVTVPEGTKEFEFPDSVVGGVKPGTLNEMMGWVAIKWGVSMTEPIEPGVIPYQGAPGAKATTCALMLDKTYKHGINREAIPDTVYLYVHDSNRQLAPFGRDLWLWRRDKPFTKDEFKGTGFKVVGDIMKTRTFKFVADGPIYVADVRRKVTQPATPLATQADLDDLKSQFYGLATKVSELEATITKLTTLTDISQH